MIQWRSECDWWRSFIRFFQLYLASNLSIPWTANTLSLHVHTAHGISKTNEQANLFWYQILSCLPWQICKSSLSDIEFKWFYMWLLREAGESLCNMTWLCLNIQTALAFNCSLFIFRNLSWYYKVKAYLTFEHVYRTISVHCIRQMKSFLWAFAKKKK